MENVNELTQTFFSMVAEALRGQLAENRKKDPKANSALVDLRVASAFKMLGAEDVVITANVAAGTKDSNKADKFTFVTVTPFFNGIGQRIDFSQRHQAHRAEVKAMEELSKGLTHFKEAQCLAGLSVVPGAEGRYEEHWSFKWEALQIDDENGIAYTGPVRKWHDDTKTYDAPVID